MGRKRRPLLERGRKPTWKELVASQAYLLGELDKVNGKLKPLAWAVSVQSLVMLAALAWWLWA